MVSALHADQGKYDGLCIIRRSKLVRWSVHYTYVKESTMVCVLYVDQGEHDGLCIIHRSRRVRWSVH